MNTQMYFSPRTINTHGWKSCPERCALKTIGERIMQRKDVCDCGASRMWEKRQILQHGQWVTVFEGTVETSPYPLTKCKGTDGPIILHSN